MCSDRRAVSLGFTPERYPEGTHICYLFNHEQERRSIVPPYITSGIVEREAVDYFADVPSEELLERSLAELGIVLPAGDKDQLLLATALDTYCPGGRFTPEAMLERLRRGYERGRSGGYVGARLSGEMTWALRGMPGSERLVEYESRINTLLETVPLTVVCQYDTGRFDGGTLFEILTVHPMIIVHGQLLRNPYFISPEEYLKGKEHS